MNEQASKDERTRFAVSLDVALEPRPAFDAFVAELAASLGRSGIEFDQGEAGRVRDAGFEAGRVVLWRPGNAFELVWRQASWAPERASRVEARFEPIEGGTRVTVEHRGWDALVGDPAEVIGWFADQVAAPALRAAAPTAFGDWFTDRSARRPSGARARTIYANPIYHYPNFRAILEELKLTSGDWLVEVGCGGGAFMREALRSGCRAAAVDHSADMVRLARERIARRSRRGASRCWRRAPTACRSLTRASRAPS